MKVVIENQQTKNKPFTYEESFWTGKRTIYYDGKQLSKVKRNVYEYKNGEESQHFEIKGNQVIGVTVNMFGSSIEVLRKLTWLEILLSFLVLIPPCVLFGAIGGLFGGALGFTNIMVIRQIDKLYLKIIISVEFIAVTLLASYVVACMIFKLTFFFM